MVSNVGNNESITKVTTIKTEKENQSSVVAQVLWMHRGFHCSLETSLIRRLNSIDLTVLPVLCCDLFMLNVKCEICSLNHAYNKQRIDNGELSVGEPSKTLSNGTVDRLQFAARFTHAGRRTAVSQTV
jgi:hypothetical protein